MVCLTRKRVALERLVMKALIGLDKEKAYGFYIRKFVFSFTQGYIVLNYSSIYIILFKLLEDKFVRQKFNTEGRSWWELTDKGQNELAKDIIL